MFTRFNTHNFMKFYNIVETKRINKNGNIKIHLAARIYKFFCKTLSALKNSTGNFANQYTCYNNFKTFKKNDCVKGVELHFLIYVNLKISEFI